MTKRALMALLMAAKFETGQADTSRYALNISASMWSSLRKQGLVDDDHRLTEVGWEIEGQHPAIADGVCNVLFA